MKTWRILESILSEDVQYRGDTYVTYGDLVKLFVGSEKSPGITGSPPDKRGGMTTGNYKFDPTILALGDSPRGSLEAWHDELDTALVRAASDSSKETGGGMGKGGTMVKKNYGGKVTMQMAPNQPHHNDRLGSGMDRYDVVIVADIDQKMNKRGVMVAVGTIKRIAWSPSIGSNEERLQRLQGFLSGQTQQLPRRPMADRPGISNSERERMAAVAARSAAADLAASEPGINPDSSTDRNGGGGRSSDEFRAKLARHNANFKPNGRPEHEPPSEDDMLFPPKRR